MINKKLNIIQQDLTEIINLVQNNDYLKFVEEKCDYVNKLNEKIIKDKKELQERIDKAIELLLDKYVRGLLNDNEVNNIVKILKGDNK